MYTTQFMGLTSWDLITDYFDHTEMDTNWKAIDQHDHSAGKGLQINTGGIANNAITTGLIAPQAVTNAQLADNAVATNNIQNQAVTNSQLGVGSVYGNVIPDGAITQPMLDPNVIPLGFIAMWWRPSGSATVPGGGWEIMDGRPWSAITNSFGLSTGNIPDMRGYFAQGADITGANAPGIGMTGGNTGNTASLAHSHIVNAHTHGVPSHSHPISADGDHMHTWQGGLSVWARTNAFGGGDLYVGADPDGWNYPYNNVTFQARDGDWVTNNYYSMYIRNLTSKSPWGTYLASSNSATGQTDGNADMDHAGSHSHGWATGGSGTLQTDGGSGTITTSTQLGGSVSIAPQNVALLFIMRCR